MKPPIERHSLFYYKKSTSIIKGVGVIFLMSLLSIIFMYVNNPSLSEISDDDRYDGMTLIMATKVGETTQNNNTDSAAAQIIAQQKDKEESDASNELHNAEDEQHSRFAYAFLVAGCHPEETMYLGYIYNIIIAKKILMDRGSTQDVFVMIRMHKDTNSTRLPPEHESIFIKAGVKFKYIPKPLVDNFHTAMMDKFQILNLTQYERVLFLDSDVMPIYNMDYMFHHSVGANATLEENVVLAYKGEPANGGFFMMKPDEQDYLELLKVIEKTENYGYFFNTTFGWGHIITPPDAWVPYKGMNGTLWNWHGAFSDQVL